jgi:hypothetical protein
VVPFRSQCASHHIDPDNLTRDGNKDGRAPPHFGALVLAQRGLPRRHITVMYVLWAIDSIGIIAYAFAGTVLHAMAIRLVTGGMSATAMVIWGTLMHRLVPSDLLGRVSSFDWLISISLVPLSFALTGPVASAIGDDATMLWAGQLGTVATIVFLFVPGIRDTEGKLSRATS